MFNLHRTKVMERQISARESQPRTSAWIDSPLTTERRKGLERPLGVMAEP